MLNKIIKFLIDNKLIAILILFVLIGWGLSTAPFDWNLNFLPRNPVAVDAIPDIGENQQIVFTKWNGRSPQDIEDQITYPLTTALMGIPGVKTIRASSMFGFSSIYIIFNDKMNFYDSRSRILEKLNSLPANLLPDGVTPSLGPDATALGQIFWYTLEGRDDSGYVTGGWDLDRLRSVQDYDVKYALASADGVAEVASIGGFVREYQVDVNPELMRQYGVTLNDVVRAVKSSNEDVGAQTLEINKVEYFVRGLGYVKNISDIENAVVKSSSYTPIRIKDIANVHIGAANRRGILDKEGAEVVGGVVTARYGANPLQVIQNVKAKMAEISPGLPSIKLKDGRTSHLTIVPFYDRTQLIHETLWTLNDALILEILVTILVIVVLVSNLKASILISGLLPVAVLSVFIAMKAFGVDANIVALSGIAIAIGTMVDVGIILTENMIRHLNENTEGKPTNQVIYEAATEVSSAIVTAVMTTIVSFIPVFTMTGAEGKLFHPLAFTKTFAILASVIVALFLIPPFAAMLFKKTKMPPFVKKIFYGFLAILGIATGIGGFWPGWVLTAIAAVSLLKIFGKLSEKQSQKAVTTLTVLTILLVLARYWRPLGFQKNGVENFIFVALISFLLLGFFALLQHYYTRILEWALHHKGWFLAIPATVFTLGLLIFFHTGQEFMPSLNEGSFLLMPTTMAHAGVEQNKETLQKLDMAVASLPEIETVVGKSGRTESALDPAPLSMYENVINYKSEYAERNGKPVRFKIDRNGYFALKNGSITENPNNPVKAEKDSVQIVPFNSVNDKELVEDNHGAYYRNWRPDIKSSDDIWNEIVKATRLPGVTSAPKLQPIETRLVMLQTGMRAPMGIKIKGNNLAQIESFGEKLEPLLKQVDGVKKEAVYADRIVGKPYLVIDIDRDEITRYGLSIDDVQKVISVAVGGMPLTQTVEGRERYTIRVRYPRELRSGPEDIGKIYVPVNEHLSVPLSQLAHIRYERGPQVIKSENAFLVGYVLFDKMPGYAETDVVHNAQKFIKQQITSGKLTVPAGISYQFTGDYENQVHANRTLKLIIPIVLVIIFLILYFQFRSVSTSLMVFTGIAVAFAGGFIMIWLYGQNWFLNFDVFGVNLRALFQMHPIYLSVAVWVGFIALFGVSTDDGVVMATYLNQSFAKQHPQTIDEIRQAAIYGGKRRIRACLMTTATTVLALLPVLTSTGRGSDIMIPMAIPSFGGMLIDMTSYFIVPVLYSWREESKLKRSPKKISNTGIEGLISE